MNYPIGVDISKKHGRKITWMMEVTIFNMGENYCLPIVLKLLLVD
jgi:hypothetical protein